MSDHDVRALTLRQPWAWAIAEAGKRVENRTRRTHYRGALLIHAGLAIDWNASLPPAAATDLDGGHIFLPRGAVVAVAELTDCHEDTGCCRPWGEPGTWHWCLENVRALPKPVRCRGFQGLWRPPAEVIEEVTAHA